MFRRDTLLARLLDLGAARSAAEDASVAVLLVSTPVVFRGGADVLDGDGNRYVRADLDPSSSFEPSCLLGQVADLLIGQGAGVVVSSRVDGGGRYLLGVGALDCLRQHGSIEVPDGHRAGAIAVLPVGERIQFLQPLHGFLRPDVAGAFDRRLACCGWTVAQRRIAIMRAPSFGGRHAVVFCRSWDSFSGHVERARAHDVLAWHLFPGVVLCLLPGHVLSQAAGFVSLADLGRPVSA